MNESQSCPNVLVIQPDQHRGTIMGCAGDKQVQTPNLDQLASEGIRFSHAASSSPVCSPFRGTMQTGLYPHTHGVIGNNILLDPELTGFAEVFADAGYATGYIGKWHLDGGVPESGSGGFIAPGPRRQGWQEWHAHEKGHSFFDVWTFDDEGNKVHMEDYDWEPTWHTDMALDFAKRPRDAETPWLFYLGYGPPHKPQECPDRFLDLYDPDTFELPPDVQGRFSEEMERDLRRAYQVYYGQVTAVDYEIGRVMQGLEDLGVAENTIVIYVSDHGDLLGSHVEGASHVEEGDLRGKGSPYATAFRVPCIVRWPERVAAGQVCDALVSSVDFTPTILDLAGLDIPEAMQGDSMAGWCLDGNGPRNEVVYLGLGRGQAGHGWRAVWDGRYVYSLMKYNVLYDHEEDPFEMHNRFEDDGYADVRAQLNEQMIRMAMSKEDPAIDAVRAVCK